MTKTSMYDQLLQCKLIDQETLLTEKGAADFLDLTPRCLQAWRSRGGGPRFVKISSRCIRYRRCDLLDWVQERLCSEISETDKEDAEWLT